MIEYFKSAYNLNTLLRIHGSALYKASHLGIISVLIHLAIVLHWNPYFRKPADNADEDNPADDLNHPYGVGVLVSSVMFLFIFRANQAYMRYWEACSALHHFMSKWMDATVMAGTFHLQSHHYDDIKPPTFFANDELNKLHLTRDRDRGNHTFGKTSNKSVLKSINRVEKKQKSKGAGLVLPRTGSTRTVQTEEVCPPSPKGRDTRLMSDDICDEGWGLVEPPPTSPANLRRRSKAVADSFPSYGHVNSGFASRPEGKTPPLFLQELAHLSSLCCAVALSTLRNDVDDAESPLDHYIPGQEGWPAADPDKLPKAVKKEIANSSRCMKILRYWLGADRTIAARTKYNAARPLLVIGGVSDNEIAFLQRAKGKYAKVMLAWGWLSEFIIREQLAGSLGDVHTAIVSRIIQSLSDGMIYYNHARKIMYIPFPFPHAQLSAFFIMVMVPTVPYLMDQYTNELWVGIVVSFLTTTCLAGMHEVARELENPFRNVPNELPLCTFQAMFNEALVTMFAGYHPDHYWDAEFYRDMLDATLYSKKEVSEGGVGGVPDNGGYRPPKINPTRPTSGGGGVPNISSTAQIVEGADEEAVRQLRELVTKQAREIEGMMSMLDDEL